MRSIICMMTLSSALGCGLAPIDTSKMHAQEQAIINGETCGAAPEFASAIAVLVDFAATVGADTFIVRDVACTGTLIAPDVVLTAAHCVDPDLYTSGLVDADRFEISVAFDEDLRGLGSDDGSDPPALPANRIRARELVMHESWSLANFSGADGPGETFDIALVFLETPIDDIVPEVVITADEVDQIVVDAEVGVAGWGYQTPEPQPETYGEKLCGQSFVNELGATEMQIGDDATTVRGCDGDSGGPVYLTVDTPHDAKQRVIGVASHKYNRELGCTAGLIYTRVDAYLLWLADTMRAGCDADTRVWCDVEGIVPPEFFDVPDENDNDAGEEKQPAGCASTGGTSALLVLIVALRRRRARAACELGDNTRPAGAGPTTNAFPSTPTDPD